MHSVSLIDVSTGYPGHVVTSGINGCLPKGEMTCLLGPNGAGKSTLLRTLCGFQPPLSGEIKVEGADISTIRPKQLARMVGVVLTERPSALNMTVRELVEMGRSPYTGFFGTQLRADRQIVDEAIDMVGIRHIASRRIATLSDGERQKAMIAKTLAQQTPVIFLDEPTAFLDYPGKVDIMMLLYRIAHRENKTVFMSTHDLELALQLADSLWLLSRHHGLNIGTPARLASEGMIDKYFRSENMEFDPGTLRFTVIR